MKGEEVTSSHKSEKSNKVPENDRRTAGFLQLLMMGVSIVLSGCVSGWNASLQVGIGEYLISFALCTFGYLCLVLCVCEMMGIIAFSGGSYGYARCTLSPFVGYLVGMCDLLQTVLYSAVFVNTISHAVALSSEDPSFMDILPLWWMAVYLVVILLLLPGGKSLWNIMMFVGGLTVVSMLFYCLPNIPRINFGEYATKAVAPFAGNAHLFINELTGPTSCYMGIDILAVFGKEAKEPTKNMPWAMFWTFVITMMFAWWVTLTVVSTSPGMGPILLNENLLFPMHMAFETIYDLSNGAANMLMVPMVFSTALAFLYAAACQMQSMSKSGLLPPFLSKTHGPNRVPVYGILTAALLGYIARVMRWHFAPHGHTLYSLSMVGACCVYISLFWCFLVFKVRYGSMDRTFTNPLGVLSAIYGICYFAVILLSILFVQLNYQALLGFVPFMILAIVYYYRVVESRQFFSKEEQSTFMKAYILNANRRRRQKQSPIMKALQRTMEIVSCEGFFWNSGKSKRPGILQSVNSFASTLSNSSNQGASPDKSCVSGQSSTMVTFRNINIPNVPITVPSDFETMSCRATKQCPSTSLIIQTTTQLALSSHDVAISPKHKRVGSNGSPSHHNKVTPMLVTAIDNSTMSLFRRSFFLSTQNQLDAIDNCTMSNVCPVELQGVLQSLVNGGTGSFHHNKDIDSDEEQDEEKLAQVRAESRKFFELIQHLSRGNSFIVGYGDPTGIIDDSDDGDIEHTANSDGTVDMDATNDDVIIRGAEVV